jgi:hypothetical protein
VARLRPRPSQTVWSLVVSPPRDRPSACWRLAWIGGSPPCERRRHAGGPGPRWSRPGQPSPTPRRHPPGCARPPRCGPRSHRLPAREPLVDRLPGPIARRQVPPGHPGTGPEQDAVEYLAVIPPAAAPLRPGRGQQRRQPLPLLVSELESPVHTRLLPHRLPSTQTDPPIREAHPRPRTAGWRGKVRIRLE